MDPEQLSKAKWSGVQTQRCGIKKREESTHEYQFLLHVHAMYLTHMYMCTRIALFSL